MKSKKASAWIWIILIIIIIIAFGIGSYFIFKDGMNNINPNEINPIPQPVIIETNKDSLCTDTDNGIDYLTKGKVTSCDQPEGVVRLCESLEDHCGKDNKSIEAYCDGDIGRLRDFSCPNGCEEGVCISDISPECDEYLTFIDNEKKIIIIDEKQFTIKAHIESEDNWASFSVNGDYGLKGKHYAEQWGNMLMVPGTNLYVSNSVVISDLKINLRKVGYDSNQEEFAEICINKQ